MKNKSYILILILISLTFALFSQEEGVPCSKLKYLTEENQNKKGQFYITYSIVDSTEKIHLFLINRSNENIKLHGLNGVLSFIIETKNQEGEWKKIDLNSSWCGTGNYSFWLPPNSYTWDIVSKTAIDDGDYETEVRFSCIVNDSLLFSNSIPAKINIERFFSPEHIVQNEINDALLRETGIEERQNLLLFKAKFHHKYKEYSKALEVVNSILEKYPSLHEARYLLGVTLVSTLSKSKDSSDYNTFGILSKAINEWRKIPKGNNKYKEAVKAIAVYSDYLPSKEDWNEVQNKDCEIINNEYHCYIKGYPYEKVRIVFKNQ